MFIVLAETLEVDANCSADLQYVLDNAYELRNRPFGINQQRLKIGENNFTPYREKQNGKGNEWLLYGIVCI